MMRQLSISHDWPADLSEIINRGIAALAAGDHGAAEIAFSAALRQEANIPEAHLGLAYASRPGLDYLVWRERLHATLQPGLCVEIGVETGTSLQLARRGTRAIGIDPTPRLPGDMAFEADTGIFAVSSDAFFAAAATEGRAAAPVDFAFIDGDHRFPQCLRDFIHLEAHMARGGVIAIHDTWPLGESTATTTRETGFYTGDCWKILPCLRVLRPDLHILTLSTPPSGLTLVTGLDPASTLLPDRLEQILASYARLPFRRALETTLNLQPNGPDAFDRFLGWRGKATSRPAATPERGIRALPRPPQ